MEGPLLSRESTIAPLADSLGYLAGSCCEGLSRLKLELQGRQEARRKEEQWEGAD